MDKQLSDDERARVAREANVVRLVRGEMIDAERVAAVGAYGTDQLTHDQARHVVVTLPHGTELHKAVGDVRWAVDVEGSPRHVFKLDVAGVALIVWTYPEPHAPQVLAFGSAACRDMAWQKIEELDAEGEQVNERNDVVGPVERVNRAAAVLDEIGDLAYRAGGGGGREGERGARMRMVDALVEIQRRAKAAVRKACPHQCQRGRLCNGCGCPGCGAKV